MCCIICVKANQTHTHTHDVDESVINLSITSINIQCNFEVVNAELNSLVSYSWNRLPAQ